MTDQAVPLLHRILDLPDVPRRRLVGAWQSFLEEKELEPPSVRNARLQAEADALLERPRTGDQDAPSKKEFKRTLKLPSEQAQAVMDHLDDDIQFKLTPAAQRMLIRVASLWDHLRWMDLEPADRTKDAEALLRELLGPGHTQR